jgi:hypothetical protein
MKIHDLDEFQGLTTKLVHRYLNHRGWCSMPDPDLRLLKPSYVTVSLKNGLAEVIEKIALIEGRSAQGLLRDINPRMRKGMPSQEALRAHRGLWLRSLGKENIATVLSRQLEEFPSPRDSESCFWPCDDNYNKTRWPTDAQGSML